MVKTFLCDETKHEFSANTYIIGKINSSCLVIDIGMRDEAIYDYIDSHYTRCLGVLLTHGHFDHIRGLPAFLKHYKDTPVYLHPEDAHLLYDSTANASYLTGESVSMNLQTIDVKDGETLHIKETNIRVIHTPFHTKGSVCYLFEDDNALFTGDTLFKNGIGRFDLETSDATQIMPSLKKLAGLKDTLVVYPGHGSYTRLGEEKKTNPYLVEASL